MKFLDKKLYLLTFIICMSCKSIQNKNLVFEGDKCNDCAKYRLELFTNGSFIYVKKTHPSNVTSRGNFIRIGNNFILKSNDKIDTLFLNIEGEKMPIINQRLENNIFKNDTLTINNKKFKYIDRYNNDTITLTLKRN